MDIERRFTVKNIIFWLLIVATTVFYFLYYKRLLEYLDLFVSLIPIAVFFITGVLVLDRDSKRIIRSKKNNEYRQSAELTWGQGLIHDLLTYFLPIVILTLPLLFNHRPDIADLLAAITTFLALTYLKLIYWHRL